MSIQGLTPTTEPIFQRISLLDCITPYVLVGGTALSLQLGTRQSEDLDFMTWKMHKNDKCEIPWPAIEKELSTIGEVQDINILDFDHVEFLVDGVKISFYASDKRSPVDKPVEFLNNIRLADIKAIGAMKMEVMLRRATYRDYYDIYSIVKSGVPIKDLIDKALKYSKHRLKSKNLLSILTSGDRFVKEASFQYLSPKYDITSQEIESFLIEVLQRGQDTL